MKHLFSEATNISDAFAFTHGATREFNFTFALAKSNCLIDICLNTAMRWLALMTQFNSPLQHILKCIECLCVHLWMDESLTSLLNKQTSKHLTQQ